MNLQGAILLGPEHKKSYQISAPVKTHWRDATCEEVGCPNYTYGFQVEIDETSPLGQFQADYIRKDRERSFTEEPGELAGMTVFTYPPGNRCFGQKHRKRIERDEIFLITGGDFRGNPRGTPAQVLRSDQWVDDFATHQDHLLDIAKRG
jgi:hypothetical protein